MLDHEEQQRKAADEKRKREAESAATGGESSTSPAGSPSSDCPVPLQSNPGAVDGLAPTSNSSSLSVSYRRGQINLTQHTGRQSRSISRSNTPPPTNPVLPLSSENQAERIGRTEGPGQLSTLPATLTTTSAVLPNCSPAGMPSDVDDPSSIPTITIARENAERFASNHPTDADRNSIYSDSPLPPLPVEAVPSTLSADEPSTSGSTSTSSSFGSLDNNTRMSARNGSGSPGSSPRTSLLNSDVQGLGKSAVLEASTVHIEDVSR